MLNNNRLSTKASQYEHTAPHTVNTNKKVMVLTQANTTLQQESYPVLTKAKTQKIFNIVFV